LVNLASITRSQLSLPPLQKTENRSAFVFRADL